MIILINNEQFNHTNICFGEKTKNKIIENSFFYNITYEDILLSVQYLYIKYSIENIQLEKYFNKYKLTLSESDVNNECKRKLCCLEEHILRLFSNTKKHVLKLKEQFENDNVKCTYNKVLHKKHLSKIDIAIKISGIWENKDEVGLIYKLIIL